MVKDFIKIMLVQTMKSVIFTVFCVLTSVAGALELPKERPNVILIVVDDLGYADMSFRAYSQPDVKTPNLDRFVQSGVRFEQAYATSPICSPSRAGLISGRYQGRWGNFWYEQGGLPHFVQTLPEVLRDYGYRTMKVGKTHLNGGQKQHPLDHGFDRFLGFIHHTWDYIRLSHKDAEAYERRQRGSSSRATIGPLMRDRDQFESYEDSYTTDIFTDEAIRFMDMSDERRPFFLYLSYNAPHHPTYVTSPKYAEMVGLEQPVWDRDAEVWSFPYWDPNKEPWFRWHRKWGHMNEIDPKGRLRYLSHVVGLDVNIGRLMAYLDESGKRDNTVVVFLSDNGGCLISYGFNTPLDGYKYMFAEGGLRIPMVFSWKGRIPAENTREHLVSAMDVFPTILDLAEIPLPENLDGRVLSPILASAEAPEVHEYLFFSDGKIFDPGTQDEGFWVVRHGRWKLIQSPGWSNPAFKLKDGLAYPAGDYTYDAGRMLFDLNAEIGEETNLIERYPDVVEKLKAAFAEWGESMIPPVRGRDRMLLTPDHLR